MDDDTLLIARFNLSERERRTKEEMSAEQNRKKRESARRGNNNAPFPRGARVIRTIAGIFAVFVGSVDASRLRSIALNVNMAHLSTEKGGTAMIPELVEARGTDPSWPSSLQIPDPREVGACEDCVSSPSFDSLDPPPLPKLPEEGIADNLQKYMYGDSTEMNNPDANYFDTATTVVPFAIDEKNPSRDDEDQPPLPTKPVDERAVAVISERRHATMKRAKIETIEAAESSSKAVVASGSVPERDTNGDPILTERPEQSDRENNAVTEIVGENTDEDLSGPVVTEPSAA